MTDHERAARNLREANELLLLSQSCGREEYRHEAVRALESALHHAEKTGNKRYIAKITKAVRAARRAA